MARIIQLEQHVADLIAAGEVVSRPASVVKELLENSIDAGAGSITCEISSGGMASIRVVDNGCGIAPDDVKTAFARHATSKLRNASDLEAIGTLGFRGEALCAIAAVSRIELLTRTAYTNEGVRLTLQGGVPSEPVPAGCPVGTTITVKDLFYNTPARLKFIKSDRAEGSAVSSLMLRCALSRPDLSIRYIRDGKNEFHTPGDCKADSCIYSLLGKEFASGLLPADLSDEFVSVKGYVSSPQACRGNRSYQFFFINGRIVRSLLLQSALEQAYKNKLMPGRFPSCVLYITASPADVDVNVHPAKTEVRFVSDKHFFDGVYFAALGALESAQEPKNEITLTAGISAPYATGKARENPSTVAQHRYGYSNTIQRDNPPAPAQIPLSADLQTGSDAASHIKPLFTQPYRYIGEIFGTYIIVERDDLVCFIDKHAVHERIHYNALCSGRYIPMSQMLLSPVVCRLGHEYASLLLENTQILENLGFSAESFGEDAIAVRSIPSDIDRHDAEPVLTDICRQLERGSAGSPDSLDKIYKIIACKAAIKAGSSSDIKELEKLAEHVMSGEITQCPHGRPVTFEMSKSALEKSVARI